MQKFKKLIMIASLFAITAAFNENTDLSASIIVEAATTTTSATTSIDGAEYSYVINTDEEGNSYITSFKFTGKSSNIGTSDINVVIPADINGIPIKEIGMFYGDGIAQIKSISIDMSESDITLSTNAFRYCTELSQFATTESDNTLIIGNSAFYDTKIRNIIFNCSVQTGQYPFGEWGEDKIQCLENITFNGPETELGTYTFLCCDNLENIIFNGKNVLCNTQSLSNGSNIEFNNTEHTYLYEDALKDNAYVKTIIFNSKEINTSSTSNAIRITNGTKHLKDVIFGLNVRKMNCIRFDADDVSSIQNIYFLNPNIAADVRGTYNSQINFWRFNSKNDNLDIDYNGKYVNSNIQEAAPTVEYKGNVTYIEGQTVSEEDFVVKQAYAQLDIVDEIPMCSDSNSLYGYKVCYYDKDGKEQQELTEGQNSIVIKYGSKQSEEITVNAQKRHIVSYEIEYIGNEKIEGQTVTKDEFEIKNVTYDNGKTDEILGQDKFEVISTDELAAGNNTIKFVINGDQTTVDGKDITYTLQSVMEKEVVSITAAQKENLEKFIGDILSEDDIIATVTYNNGKTESGYKGFTISNNLLSREENVIIVTSDNGKTTEITIKAIPIVITGIEAVYTNPKYVDDENYENAAILVEGQVINPEHLSIYINYNNHTRKELTEKDKCIISNDKIVVGENELKIKYYENETVCKIIGIERKIVALKAEKSQLCEEKTWYTNDVVSKEDFVITATYNDDTVDEDYKDYSITKETEKLLQEMNTIEFIDNSEDNAGVKCTFDNFAATPLKVTKLTAIYDTGKYPVEVGKEIDIRNIEVTATYNNGLVENDVKDFTIADYEIKEGYNEITVLYKEGKAVIKVQGVVLNPTQVPTTPKPTAVEEPTLVPTVIEEPTVAPEPTVIPSQEPKATVTPRPTATKAPIAQFTYKSSNSKIKLYSTSAKTTYKVYTNKTIKLTPKAANGKVYYQIVKKGKKMSSKAWKTVSNSVSIKTNMTACVYFKYTQNGKTVIKKTSGFVFDKTAPKISVSTKGKLTVKDTGSGIKKITANGKTVKSGAILKNGKYTVVATDKAGNKKSVKVIISK